MIEIVDDNERIEFSTGGAVFVLRRMTPDAHEAIAQRRTRRYRGRSGEWVKEMDEQGVFEDTVDHVILEWQGVNHPLTKQAVPCARENKVRLPARVLRDIMEYLGDAEATCADETRADLKNSNGSSA